MTSDQNTHANDAERRDALAPGSVIRDYRVERVLGSGGFGIVYLARHEELGRLVAVKEYLPTECAIREDIGVQAKGKAYRKAFEEGLSRFRDEARRLVELDVHPAIVSCNDFFRANGTAYLVMEYAEGRPLSDVLREREAAGQPFGQADMMNVIVPLLQGLAQVHAAGVIHRDVKPSNIMIRNSDGYPVLIDFGAAKRGVAELSKSMAPYTEGYAAFEQVGEGQLGPWTDVYAVGAVMWRIVAGNNRPWEPPNPVRVESRARAQLDGKDDPLPSARELGAGRFSAGVVTVIENCLRLRETERIQSCSEALRALEGARPVAVRDASQPEVQPYSVSRYSQAVYDSRRILAVAATLMLFGAVTAALLLQVDRQDRTLERATAPPPPPTTRSASTRGSPTGQDARQGPASSATKPAATAKKDESAASASIAELADNIPSNSVGGTVEDVLGNVNSKRPTAAPPPPPPPVKKKAPPTRIRVGGNIAKARLTRQVRPQYPPLARQARVQGTVKLSAVISKDGSIQKLEVMSGHPLLVPSALAAVKQWRYRPTLLYGQAVEVLTNIDVNFTLSG